ncbi:MAG: class I SAM-dependent RNA methyltransferase [Candidatus Nanopelagicales bacterium]
MARPHRDRLPLAAGDQRIVTAGPIAHGGHVVAHTDGWAVFVRGALPGEEVRIRIREVGAKVARADVADVIVASPDRVAQPCAWAGTCGGCDFQHVALPAQRSLKQQVLVDALTRFGGAEQDLAVLDTTVRELPGHPDGLRWRTRMRWAVDGATGLRGHRSHAVVPVGSCLLAVPALDRPELPVVPDGTRELVAAQGSDGAAAFVPLDGRGRPLAAEARLVERAGTRRWRITPTGFWQVHPGLAEALQQAVLDLGRPEPGQSWWDLYSGAGLLSAALADAVGADGNVEAVDASTSGVRDARRALHDAPWVRLHLADVAAWLAGSAAALPRPNGIVLDPPRAGAGLAVVDALAKVGPDRLVYVACDPVALGRDIGRLRPAGYRLRGLQALDAFPMTHHLEAVALLERVGSG